MKVLNFFAALTFLFSFNAKGEAFSANQAAHLPTLCIGQEVRGPFGRGLAVVISYENSKISAQIHSISLYGFHVQHNEVVGSFDLLQFTELTDGGISIKNDDIELLLSAEINSRWNASLSSSTVARVGSNYPVTCSMGSLTGSIRNYLP